VGLVGRAIADRLIPIAVSAVLDATLREPPARAHPVVWAGRYLAAAARVVPAAPRRRAVAAGSAAWAIGLAAAVVGGWAGQRLTRSLPWVPRAALTGVLLWPLWSGRLLVEEVAAVETAVRRSPDDGRAALGRIVSRDTASLSVPEIREAALESLAENLSDSVVAPLLWFAVGGLPMAAGYRYVNTADACWGHRTPRWRHAGWSAAVADDVLNVVPARLTGRALLLGCPREVRGRLTGQAARTPSPNSGWPMAALALRLDVRLTKPGAYVLNGSSPQPQADDVRRALRLLPWRSRG
jgi:adenosylcobinamide-phosphate synthase